MEDSKPPKNSGITKDAWDLLKQYTALSLNFANGFCNCVDGYCDTIRSIYDYLSMTVAVQCINPQETTPCGSVKECSDMCDLLEVQSWGQSTWNTYDAYPCTWQGVITAINDGFIGEHCIDESSEQGCCANCGIVALANNFMDEGPLNDVQEDTFMIVNLILKVLITIILIVLIILACNYDGWARKNK